MGSSQDKPPPEPDYGQRQRDREEEEARKFRGRAMSKERYERARYERERYAASESEDMRLGTSTGQRYYAPANASQSQKSAVWPPQAAAPAYSRPTAYSQPIDRPATSTPVTTYTAPSVPVVNRPTPSTPVTTYTAAPVVNRPAYSQLAPVQPLSRPATSTPVTTYTTAPVPVVSRPAYSQPASATTTSSVPVVNRPAYSQPAPVQPLSRPATSTPVTTYPAPSVPVVNRQAYSSPAPVQPPSRPAYNPPAASLPPASKLPSLSPPPSQPTQAWGLPDSSSIQGSQQVAKPGTINTPLTQSVIPLASPSYPTSFPSLLAYQSHFLSLLRLEREAISRNFSPLLKSVKFTCSPDKDRFLYIFKLKSIDELGFGDQFLLTYNDEDHPKQVVHIYKLDEMEKKVHMYGKFNDLRKVEYYRSLPHRRMEEKLESLTVDHPLIEEILGNGERLEELQPYFRLKTEANFDESQQKAILAAIQGKVTLILGPPGSGKTSVAGEVISQISHLRPGKILVCAPSNVAADNLALKLKEKHVRTLRIYSKGSEEKTNICDRSAFHSYVHSLACVCFPNRTEQLLKLESFSRRSVSNLIGAEEIVALERDVLESFQVVCCTCSTAADAIMANIEVETVLIDEAAFCNEVEAMIPIIVTKCKKLILIGDPKQLRPILQSEEAKKNGLEISLFERLNNMGTETKWLSVQYRMHPDISIYPRTQFYSGRLTDGITAADRSLAGKKIDDFFRSKPLLFIHSDEMEKKYPNTDSYWNSKEVKVVLMVLETMKKMQVPLKDIGVVTPYEGQRVTLVKRVQETLGLTEKDVEIKNIDGYQGREKNFIIMSCVRSNNTQGKHPIGFLGNPNRINVALTRAKYGLVVVGNKNTLRVNGDWAGFVETVEERGRVMTAEALEDLA